MIYINSNSTNILIPKVDSVSPAYKIVFENQVTHYTFEQMVVDTGTSTVYQFDISTSIQFFENGQYDYYVKKIDNTVLASGILQFGEYTSQTSGYQSDINIIQYNPDEDTPTPPTRSLEIFENGTYDVTNYDEAIVNVETPTPVQGGQLEITDWTIDNLPHNMDMYNNGVHMINHWDAYINTNAKDLSTLLDNKDLYVGICAYKSARNNGNTPNRVMLINDRVLKDSTLKMHCWKYIDGSEMFFAYTINDYEDVEDLMTSNPKVYIKRLPKNGATEPIDDIYYDVVLINQLTEGGFADVWGDVEHVSRATEYDIISYINPKNDSGWSGKSKKEKIDYIISESVTERGGIDTYNHYCYDFPIIPFKLSECKIHLKDDGWTLLGDVTVEDEVSSLLLKIPYDGNHLFLRKWQANLVETVGGTRTNIKNVIDNTYCRKVGSSANCKVMLVFGDNDAPAFVTQELYFTLLNSNDILHGNRTSHNMIRRKMILAKGGGLFVK